MRMIPLTDRAIECLEKRGIDPELAERYGVSSVELSRPSRHEWVCFPHFDGGTTAHWVARVVSDPKPDQWCTQQKGGRRCLWNQDVIHDETLMKQSPLLITEGHLDALALMTVGFRAVTSVPDGSSGTEPTAGDHADLLARDKYRYLADIRDQLRKWPSVIIATDGDGPGRALFDDLARIVGRSKCRVLDYPADCKDANDVLMKHGSEALVSAVESARWVHIGGIYELDTLPPVHIPPAVSCGITGIDALWRFRPGELSVLCGIPNHGKTILANQIGMALAQNAGWVVAYCSPEQFWPIHVERLITTWLGSPAKFASDEERERARAFIRGHIVWLARESREQQMTVAWLCERIVTVAWRYNVKMVIVDPWNQLDHDRDTRQSMGEYSGEMLKQIGLTAQDAGVHVLLVCHPHKPQGAREGKVPMPNGYSIADSAHFVNRPDLGATLYRDDEKRETVFWCWKARLADGEWYDNGKLGIRKLGLNTLSMRFAEIASVEDEA
jgi:twinkle protein